MRYIKVLILAIIFFLAMVFFFQNQAPLSQEMTLTLNLFFIPPMTSISLPFYFLVIAAFFVGVLLAWAFLLWDKFNISTKLMKSRWQISSLQKEIARLQKQLASDASVSLAPAMKEDKKDASKPRDIHSDNAPHDAKAAAAEKA